MDKILWSSQKPPMRYFWVPAGEDVFVGDYGIENNEGESFSVELESLIPFEISGAEAEALMMQDLENMTKELGGLFKGLFQLGKRMLDNEILEEDSDEDSDSDWDSDADSEDYSDDADLDAELDDILALFDEDSDEDSDSDDDNLDAILSKLGEDLEGSLTELRDLIAKEVGNLGEELDTIGKEAAEAIDEEPEAGQSILRELGSWLIRLADEQDANSEDASSEEPIIMPFPSIPEPEFALEDSAGSDTITPPEFSEETMHETSASVSEKKDENAVVESHEEDSEVLEVDGTIQQATETEHPTVELPSSSALKRMNKADLVELGTTLGLSLSSSTPKKDLLSAIETLR